MTQRSIPLSEDLRYVRLQPPQMMHGNPPPEEQQPGPSAVLKCPLPLVGGSPDSLRQFYRGHHTPIRRIFSQQ